MSQRLKEKSESRNWVMRENGNSAFILFLEFIYCALLYFSCDESGPIRYDPL